MKKLLIVSILSFSIGILSHALLFPDFLSRTANFNLVKNKILGEKEQSKSRESEFLTVVSYKSGAFHPEKVWIKLGNYLAIRNVSETEQMWLVSDLPELGTVRGYGLSEQQQSRMDKLGTFTVSERNSQSQLVIVVQAN